MGQSPWDDTLLMVDKKQLIRNIVSLHEKLETKTSLMNLDKKQRCSQVIRNIIKVVSRRNIYCITRCDLNH